MQTGISLYQNYRWMPELTIPLAATLIEQLGIKEDAVVLDYGCAKGFLVRALRLLHRQAYGYDISSYAYEQAPRDVRPYLLPLEVTLHDLTAGGPFQWVICKDVLEHVPPNMIKPTLRLLRALGTNLWAAIPLGDGERYYCPVYEQDKTHRIREDIGWWRGEFIEAGFNVTEATYSMRHVKSNWDHFEKGNGFFRCE